MEKRSNQPIQGSQVIQEKPASVRPVSTEWERDRKRFAEVGEAFARRHAELLIRLAK